MSKGWISIHRELQGNWLWKEKREFSKLEAWLDILLTVNHSEKKVMIKNTLFTVKRGQSINSLETWSNRWKWSRGRVKRFFDLLKNDGMIDFKTNCKTTELTVCKYDSYQGAQTSNEHLIDIKRTSNEHQTNINNNTNNNNNINNVCVKENSPTQIIKKDIELDFTESQFLERWRDARMFYDKKPTNISKLMPFELTDFNEIKKHYSKNQIEMAMSGLFQQKTLPTVRLRPTHFLKINYFEQYLTCFTTKEKLFEDKKYKKPIERI